MSNPLFRKKSIEKVSAPEDLHDYIKISTPSIWLVLIAIIVLLIGICAWAFWGRMDTVMEVAAVSDQSSVSCFIKEDDAFKITEGMKVKILDSEYSIQKISQTPIQIEETADTYLLHLGKFTIGEWVYVATVNTDLPEGIYQAGIITERISPLSFVVN